MATDPPVLVVGAAPAMLRAVTHCLRRAGHASLALNWNARLRAAPYPAQVRAVMAADPSTALQLARTPGALPLCAMPGAALIATLSDPWNLARLLAAVGLPAPDSVRADTVDQLRAAPLLYPIVTLPLAGGAQRLHRSPAALSARDTAGRLPLLAQSHADGWHVGASFIARNGELLACSVYRRMRRGRYHFYPSARVPGYVRRFVAAADYHGAGHLALRYAPRLDSYFILRLHAGFGPALWHEERAGVNYPDLLLRLDHADAVWPPLPGPVTVRLPWYRRVGSG